MPNDDDDDIAHQYGASNIILMMMSGELGQYSEVLNLISDLCFSLFSCPLITTFLLCIKEILPVPGTLF